jgi:alanyl-tRNA synthetase
LTKARSIAGLRAVFGEVYPDPVRVLSVGPRLDAILENPSQSTWQDYSIEFCGGTHVTNTKEAEQFVLTEETAVAKGIRRISGMTGMKATNIYLQSQQILTKVDALAHAMSTASTSPSSTSSITLPIDSYELELAAIRQQLESEDYAQATKLQCRERLEKIQKAILAEKKKQMMKKVEETMKNVLEVS